MNYPEKLENCDMDPVAWLHVLDNTEGIEENQPEQRLTFSSESPYGVPGVDHSEEFPVTSTPLFAPIEHHCRL